MSFKDISYLELWWPSCLAEWNHLCNFSRGNHEEHFCEIILNFDQWFRRKWRLKIFLIWSWQKKRSLLISGGKSFCNFVRGHHEVHFSEIV